MSGSRRMAREYALRGLYGWLLSRQDHTDISATLREDAGFRKADEGYFNQLLQGAINAAPDLEAKLRPVSTARSANSPRSSAEYC